MIKIQWEIKTLERLQGGWMARQTDGRTDGITMTYPLHRVAAGDNIEINFEKCTAINCWYKGTFKSQSKTFFDLRK